MLLLYWLIGENFFLSHTSLYSSEKLFCSVAPKFSRPEIYKKNLSFDKITHVTKLHKLPIPTIFLNLFFILSTNVAWYAIDSNFIKYLFKHITHQNKRIKTVQYLEEKCTKLAENPKNKAGSYFSQLCAATSDIYGFYSCS